MDDQLNQLREHLDGRFDRIEGKLDTVMERTTVHATDIGYLRVGFAFLISIVIGVAGFLASGFFDQFNK